MMHIPMMSRKRGDNRENDAIPPAPALMVSTYQIALMVRVLYQAFRLLFYDLFYECVCESEVRDGTLTK
jgi:hypothetical protein